MKTFSIAMTIAWLGLASVGAAQNTVVITEFMADPIGQDEAREYVELYNYGPATVNLMGWKLEDERNESTVLPDYNLPSGGFVIVLTNVHGQYDSWLPAEKKALFEKEWFGGKSEDRIIPEPDGPFRLDDADQIILLNPLNVVVWQVAYRDTVPGQAVFYANFDPAVFKITKKFGTGNAPGVVRRGNDNGVQPEGQFPGYEGNELSQDEDAWKSDAAALAEYEKNRVRPVDERGDDAEPGIGSPLKGSKYPVFK